MKIIHLGDTHLGYSAYRKVTSEGINQREVDIYNSFIQIVDYAIQNNVDLILHAGDLFDSVRPNNRAITIAFQQLLRLSEHQIPFVLISGNHEQPKLQETGHIFTLFEHIPHVYPVYHEQYEKKEFIIEDEKILIHCLPQINKEDVLQSQLTLIDTNDAIDYNLFLGHGSIQGIKEFSMNEFNEMMLPKQFLSEMFDYVALGHYHIHTKIDEHVFYSGASDTFSFSEANTDHGCMEITFQNTQRQIQFRPMRTRTFLTSPPIECFGKNVEEIMDEIIQTIQKIDPVDKIFRINLSHIQSHQYRSLDFRLIRHSCQGCLHYEINAAIEEQDRNRIESHGRIDTLTEEFDRFMRNQHIDERERILKKGLAYIHKIQQKEDI